MNPLDETLPPTPTQPTSEEVLSADTAHVEAGSITGESTVDCRPANQANVLAADVPLHRRDNVASPQRFGNYELLEPIGRGGMGVVFKARQLGLNRIVALKRIRSAEFAGTDEIQRFRAEAEAAAALDHSGIVPIYEVGEVAGQPFYSMGYVAGESLQERIAVGPLGPRAAAEIVQQVAEAVEYAHQSGIVHRDLKPGNILLDANGKPRVTDFGLAKRTAEDSGLTMTGQVLGTPAYMPPEQAQSQHDRVGPRSDVYALGAVLYALLTGRPPFQAASRDEIIRQVLHDEPLAPRKLNPSIPVDLETIALKCLEKDATRRYHSTADFAADLRRFLDHEPVAARPISSGSRFIRWCRRQPMAAGLLAAGSALVFVIPISIVATGAFFWIRSEANRARAAEVVAKTERAEAVRQRRVAETQRQIAGNERTKTIAARNEQERQLKLAKEELTSVQAEIKTLEDKIKAMTEKNSQVRD